MARQRLTAEFKREAVRLLERGEKPVTQVAAKLGVARNRLYKWRDALQMHGDHAFAGFGKRSPQQQKLAELRRELARQGRERDPKQSDGVLRERTQARYAWIEGQRVNHRLADLCRALRVSASVYHAWRQRASSPRTQADTRLAVIIAAAHHEYREAYGSRRLWRLLRMRGITCGRHRMDRLQREQNLWTRRRRRFVRARAAYQCTPAAPRLLEWPFAAISPDLTWVGDITQLPTRDGLLYLAIIMDVYSRRVVGWAMDDHQRIELTERALDMALQHRRPRLGLTLHHDRSSQYTGARYRAQAEDAQIRLSMSRRACRTTMRWLRVSSPR